MEVHSVLFVRFCQLVLQSICRRCSTKRSKRYDICESFNLSTCLVNRSTAIFYCEKQYVCSLSGDSFLWANVSRWRCLRCPGTMMALETWFFPPWAGQGSDHRHEKISLWVGADMTYVCLYYIYNIYVMYIQYRMQIDESVNQLISQSLFDKNWVDYVIIYNYILQQYAVQVSSAVGWHPDRSDEEKPPKRRPNFSSLLANLRGHGSGSPTFRVFFCFLWNCVRFSKFLGWDDVILKHLKHILTCRWRWKRWWSFKVLRLEHLTVKICINHGRPTPSMWTSVYIICHVYIYTFTVAASITHRNVTHISSWGNKSWWRIANRKNGWKKECWPGLPRTKRRKFGPEYFQQPNLAQGQQDQVVLVNAGAARQTKQSGATNWSMAPVWLDGGAAGLSVSHQRHQY